MMILIAALGSFALAVALGVWRRRYGFHVPQNRGPGDQVAGLISWIAVAMLSVFSAFVVVGLVGALMGRVVGTFFFGVVLVARWSLSNLVWMTRDRSG
jgi:hypothetical protein